MAARRRCRFDGGVERAAAQPLRQRQRRVVQRLAVAQLQTAPPLAAPRRRRAAGAVAPRLRGVAQRGPRRRYCLVEEPRSHVGVVQERARRRRQQRGEEGAADGERQRPRVRAARERARDLGVLGVFCCTQGRDLLGGASPSGGAPGEPPADEDPDAIPLTIN